MVWPRRHYRNEHSPRFNYSDRFHSAFPNYYHDRRGPVVIREEKGDDSMKTAVYVGAGVLGIVGIGALIYLIAKK